MILKSAQYKDQACIYKHGHQTQHWFQALALHNMQHLLTGVSYRCTASSVWQTFALFCASSPLKNASVPPRVQWHRNNNACHPSQFSTVNCKAQSPLYLGNLITNLIQNHKSTSQFKFLSPSIGMFKSITHIEILTLFSNISLLGSKIK